MLIRPRQRTGVFSPLPAEAIPVLLEDPDLRERYVTALCYMHDLVCPYWDYPDAPRFGAQDARIDLGATQEIFFSSDSPLSRHVQDNIETALTLGERGADVVLQGSEADRLMLKREATSFINGLLHTYNQVRLFRTAEGV